LGSRQPVRNLYRILLDNHIDRSDQADVDCTHDRLRRIPDDLFTMTIANRVSLILIGGFALPAVLIGITIA
jgi:hypothetical protein